MSQQYATPFAPVQVRRNGLGTAAFVIGLVSMGLSWIPIVGFISLLLGVVGIGLAIGGTVRVSRGAATNGVVTWLGGALSALSMVASLVAFSAFVDSTTQPALHDASVATAPKVSPVAPVPKVAGGFGGDGVYVVGTDVRPGTYRSRPATGTFAAGVCYWARLRNTDGDLEAILTNDLAQGPTTVTIKASDGAFKTQGCQDWTPVR